MMDWNQRFNQLKEYKEKHGDCDVPQRYKANPQLGMWANNQRSIHNKTKKGKLSPVQIKSLEDIGFVWELRRRPRSP